jgi:glycosyltransferase involved in cell wall biosynthesis
MKHKFINTYQHVPVEEYHNTVLEKPLVSVCIQTYQQETTISSCLEGILEQKTTFDYEILIAEDQSSDKTREICIFFAKKYPDKIRLFLHSRKNNIRIDGRASGRFNYIYNFIHARGKYIAFCDGDDLWNDPHKLEKQVNILENHLEIGLVHTDNLIENQRNNKLSEYRKADKYHNKNIFKELIIKNHITTSTVVARINLINAAVDNLYKNVGIEMIMDYSIWLYIAQNSKIFHLPEITAIYRLSINSASRQDDKELHYLYIKKIFDIKMYYCKSNDFDIGFMKQLKLNYLRKRLYYEFLNLDRENAVKTITNIRQLNGYLSLGDRVKNLGSKNKLLNLLMKILHK